MRPLIASLLAVVTLWAGPSQAEVRLIMAEETGCIWCARWNDEIAPVYPKTPEGRAAPLRRIDVNAPIPDDLRLDGRLHYTPTFVLVRDGDELGRIEGYPGEAFFWGLLRKLLDEAGAMEAEG